MAYVFISQQVDMPPYSPERLFDNVEELEQLITDVEDVTAHKFLLHRLLAQVEFEHIVDELFTVGIEYFNVGACFLEEWFSIKRNTIKNTYKVLSRLQISFYFF